MYNESEWKGERVVLFEKEKFYVPHRLSLQFCLEYELKLFANPIENGLIFSDSNDK